MSCTDPERAAMLMETEFPKGAAWRDHLAACETCRQQHDQLLHVTEDTEVHPAGSVLVTFDEEPESLLPGTRRFVSAHLERCQKCRSALTAFPPLEPPRPLLAAHRRWWVTGLSLAALLLLAVVFEQGGPKSEQPFVQHATTWRVPLSRRRGGASPTIPTKATLLLFEPALGMPVKVGTPILLVVLDGAKHEVLRKTITVGRLDPDWGWPVLPVKRGLLPAGKLQIVITLPSGRSVSFPFVHRPS